MTQKYKYNNKIHRTFCVYCNVVKSDAIEDKIKCPYEKNHKWKLHDVS